MLKTGIQAGTLEHVLGMTWPLLKAVFTPLSHGCPPVFSFSLMRVFARAPRGSCHQPTNGDLLTTVPGEAVNMGT